MRTLVIIPCYNERETIISLCREVEQATADAGIDFIVVNDCSTDNSLRLLKENGISYLNLPLNLGIGGAVQCGYKYALKKGYDIAVQLDGDGQHNPACVKGLIAPIVKGEADMVIGSRFLEKAGFQSSVMRRLGIKIFSMVIFCLTGKRVKDTTSGFRAVNRNVLKLFADDYAKDYPEPESNFLALRNKYKVVEVPVEMRERKGGVSSIKALLPAYYMIKVLIAIFLCALKGRVKAKTKRNGVNNV